MATLLEQRQINQVIQQSNIYFRNNIGLYPTRSDIASVVPGLIAENGAEEALARNIINGMSPNNFCVPNLESGNIIDLCETVIPPVIPDTVARLFPGSVTIDDVKSGCLLDNVIVSGCECDFSVICNGAAGLSGTLYYARAGEIDDNCLCGAGI